MGYNTDHGMWEKAQYCFFFGAGFGAAFVVVAWDRCIASLHFTLLCFALLCHLSIGEAAGLGRDSFGGA
jgi:hypothetical protein